MLLYGSSCRSIVRSKLLAAKRPVGDAVSESWRPCRVLSPSPPPMSMPVSEMTTAVDDLLFAVAIVSSMRREPSGSLGRLCVGAYCTGLGSFALTGIAALRGLLVGLVERGGGGGELE